MIINILGLIAIAFVVYWFWFPTQRKKNVKKSK